MSRETIELTHRCVDAFNRRDLEALLALMEDDVEGAPPLASMEGNYHGHAGIRRWWESLARYWVGMSREHVEIVRRAYEAWNARDFESGCRGPVCGCRVRKVTLGHP